VESKVDEGCVIGKSEWLNTEIQFNDTPSSQQDHISTSEVGTTKASNALEKTTKNYINSINQSIQSAQKQSKTRFVFVSFLRLLLIVLYSSKRDGAPYLPVHSLSSTGSDMSCPLPPNKTWINQQKQRVWLGSNSSQLRRRK
jgi:hypothetical protein